jgi:hypothetical protein
MIKKKKEELFINDKLHMLPVGPELTASPSEWGGTTSRAHMPKNKNKNKKRKKDRERESEAYT